MLKILHIIPSLSKGGAEHLVLNICNELTKRENITVKLITFSDKSEYPDLIQNIDYEVIPASIHLSLFKKNKFKIEKLQNTITNFQPDIIHTHLFEGEIVSRSCYYPSAKWFSHCHDNMRQFKNFYLHTLTNKRLFTNFYEKKYLFNRYKANGGTHFIAISKDTQKYFEKTAGPYPVALLPNAIDFSRFFKFRKNDVNSNNIRLINIGSFVDKKNQMFLVDVAQVLRSRNIDFAIHLLGDGPNKLKIQNKIDHLSFSKHVILHGIVNNVEEFLWNSDLYIHSATYEQFGLVLLEAMAAGLPVVCLDGKGNRDIIEQGKNGFMIYEQKAELFAEKIIELIEDKELYKSMSAYAVEFARKYDIKEYVDRLIAFYKSI